MSEFHGVPYKKNCVYCYSALRTDADKGRFGHGGKVKCHLIMSTVQ